MDEELIAVEAQLEYLATYNENPNLGLFADNQSSWLYLWMIPYEKAYERIEQIWQKLVTQRSNQ